MMRTLCTIILSFGLVLLAPTQEARASEDTLTFGIVPQQSASRLAKTWGPVLRELSSEIGVEVQFRTAKDIPTFEACLAAGAYDIAYMNPMHYAVFSQEAAYRAIARQSNKRLKGIIVARRNAAIQDLGDLNGEQIAFPSPGAFGASVLTRSALDGMGVEFDANYVKSHDSVYRAVAAGLMAAGGGVTRTFRSVDPAIAAELEIIYETQAFTPHAIALHPELGAGLPERIKEALLRLSSEHADLVQAIGMEGFEIAQDSDWDDVRGLQIERDQTGILMSGDVVCPSD